MYSGGIDIGGTKISAGVVSSGGSVIDFSEYNTSGLQNPEIALGQIGKYFKDISQRIPEPIWGVGIGCTGPVDPFSGQIGAVEFLRGWEGFNIVSAFSKIINVPVYLENDADASAMGEALFGAGLGSDHFVNVTVGTGIGVGAIFNNKLYRGVDGIHPEIGHHIIDCCGPSCSCGAHGCWESMAGGKATLSWAKRKFGIDYQSTAKLYEAARSRNSDALEAVRNEAFYLGIGISNIITIFAPDTISISGGILRCQDLIWDLILQTVKQNCGLVPTQKVRIVPSMLGQHTGLIGAASICLSSKVNHD